MNYKDVATINRPDTQEFHPMRGYEQPDDKMRNVIEKLKDTRINHELDKLSERIQSNAIQYEVPTMDSIVVAKGLKITEMLWKCRDGKVRYVLGDGQPKYLTCSNHQFIAWPCEVPHLLEIIEELMAKVSQMQETIEESPEPSGRVFVDVLNKEPKQEQAKVDLANAALGLLK